MPEAEENKQELVDIDTSGPGAEIEIDEPKEKVEVVNETTEDNTKPADTPEKPDVHPDVQKKVAAVWEDCLGCMDDDPLAVLVR